MWGLQHRQRACLRPLTAGSEVVTRSLVQMEAVTRRLRDSSWQRTKPISTRAPGPARRSNSLALLLLLRQSSRRHQSRLAMAMAMMVAGVEALVEGALLGHAARTSCERRLLG